MQAKLRSTDCVIEVHDARIPLSGRNPSLFEQMVGPKPHVLILNKSDLIPSSIKSEIKDILQSQMSSTHQRSIIFTNSKNDKCPGVRELVPTMVDMIRKSDRFHRSTSKEFHAMIIGIPNVGKSSLINVLRVRNLKKGRAVKVGPSAGVTKCVHEKVRISDAPLIYLYDTPGILEPRIPNPITGMKLAACANLPDAQVGLVNIADFVLFNLNKVGCFKYVKYCGLSEPSDCIATVLSACAKQLNFVQKVTSMETNSYVLKPDFEATAVNFILAYRRGDLGKFTLDKLDCAQEIQQTYKDHIVTLEPENFNDDRILNNNNSGSNSLDPCPTSPRILY